MNATLNRILFMVNGRKFNPLKSSTINGSYGTGEFISEMVSLPGPIGSSEIDACISFSLLILTCVYPNG